MSNGMARAREIAAEAEARAASARATSQLHCIRHGPYWPAAAYDGNADPEAPTRCPACVREEDREEDQRREEARSRKAWLDMIGLRGRFREASFDNFVADTKDKRAVLSRCKEFAETEEPDGGGTLFLIGGPGTGKTHLACAIAKHVVFERKVKLHVKHEVYEVPMGSRVITQRELIREIRSTWSKDSEFTEDEKIDEFSQTSLLVLDEAGAGFGSDTELVQLFDVIDRRYQLQRPHVLISNLNLPMLRNALGDRLMDRLLEDSTVLVFDWPSHRTGRA